MQAERLLAKVRLDHVFLVPDRQNGALETVPTELPKQQLQKWATGDVGHPFGSISNNTPQPKTSTATQQYRISGVRHRPRLAQLPAICRTLRLAHRPRHYYLYLKRRTGRIVASSVAPSSPAVAPAARKTA